MALLLSACASPQPPTEHLAVAAAAVAHAAAAGGNEGAPGDMGSARDKLARANAAMTTKDYDNAGMLAQQALVDAQLAEARTEAGKARKAAQETQEAARALGEEMNRKVGPPAASQGTP